VVAGGLDMSQAWTRGVLRPGTLCVRLPVSPDQGRRAVYAVELRRADVPGHGPAGVAGPVRRYPPIIHLTYLDIGTRTRADTVITFHDRYLAVTWNHPFRRAQTSHTAR